VSDFVANRDQVVRAVARVRAAVESHGADPGPPLELDPASALAQLSAAFELTPFERDVLILAAAPELDGTFATLLGTVCGEPGATTPTLSLALATLSSPAWSAVRPDAPLRRWKLVSIGGPTLTAGPLRVDEAILHALLGFPWHDDLTRGFLVPFEAPPLLLSATQSAVVQLAATALGRAPRPSISLVCPDVVLARIIATAIGVQLQRNIVVIRAASLPTVPADLRDALTAVERTARVTRSLLVIEHDESDDPQRERALESIVERTTHPLILITRTRLAMGGHVMPSFDASRPSTDEQATTWSTALGQPAPTDDARRLAAQFDLDLAAIQAVVAGAGDNPAFDALWSLARSQARPRLDSLAERVEANAGWRDLVLPPERRKTLRTIVDAVRHRDRVYREWGFDRGANEARGMTVLFSGPSGTGKTMAAKVLARALRLDLYRIDLAVVFSKYIGETEKNLRRIFDAAEAGGIVLLFDEADALFGKRSDVKDSHDRHANVEVSYLLQRLERFNGVAVLTSNLRDAFDNAFLRRFAFVVEFPFPDEHARRTIWRHVFPPSTPTLNLNFDQLAKLALPGGNIHTIARNAAVRAAARNRAVTMRDVADAARIEYTKIGQGQGASDLLRWLEAV